MTSSWMERIRYFIVKYEGVLFLVHPVEWQSKYVLAQMVVTTYVSFREIAKRSFEIRDIFQQQGLAQPALKLGLIISN